MSTPAGPGWWLASDGRWYPPELHPAASAPPAPPTSSPWVDAPTGVAPPAGRPRSPDAAPPFYGTTQYPSAGAGVADPWTPGLPDQAVDAPWSAGGPAVAPPPTWTTPGPGRPPGATGRRRAGGRRWLVALIVVALVGAGAVAVVVTRHQSSAAGAASFRAGVVSCGTPLDCVALPVGFLPNTQVAQKLVYTTSDGGGTWSTVSTGSDLAPGVLSCPSGSTCIALGVTNGQQSTAMVTTDGGASWTAGGTLDNGFAANVWTDIDCLSDQHCVAIGRLFGAVAGPELAATTTDGGSTWSLSLFPSSVANAYGLACPSPTRCVALGIEQEPSGGTTTVAVTSDDGGATWAVGTVVELQPVSASASAPLSCPSATACVAVGETSGSGGTAQPRVAVSRDGGTTWSAGSVPSSPDGLLLSVACPTASACVAVGGDAQLPVPRGFTLSSTDGGATWSAGTLPAGTKNLYWVSCPTTTRCVAVGVSGAVVSNDGGRTWTS